MLSENLDILKQANIRSFDEKDAKIVRLQEKEQKEDVLMAPKGKIHVYVPKGVSYKAFIFSTGQALEFVVHLTGEKAIADITVGYILSEKVKNHLNINVLHEACDTLSNQKVRGVLFDEAKNTFEGLIRVYPGANGVEANQSHKALLLSDKSFVNGQPELEIFNDDVACSHGNAIGQLDENQIFYLMSRGFSEKEAKKILIEAFLFSVLEDHFPEWKTFLDVKKI